LAQNDFMRRASKNVLATRNEL